MTGVPANFCQIKCQSAVRDCQFGLNVAAKFCQILFTMTLANHQLKVSFSAYVS